MSLSTESFPGYLLIHTKEVQRLYLMPKKKLFDFICQCLLEVKEDDRGFYESLLKITGNLSPSS